MNMRMQTHVDTKNENEHMQAQSRLTWFSLLGGQYVSPQKDICLWNFKLDICLWASKLDICLWNFMH